MFGVFDGHGGFEVSHYVCQHFEEILVENENFKKGRMEEAFKETFLKLE
jgi:serine/threonine protein phosphatase PrpC